MRVSFGDEVSRVFVSPMFGKSVRYTDGLRCVRVDDRQFAAFGEELSSLVPRQGLSTCVSERFDFYLVRKCLAIALC